MSNMFNKGDIVQLKSGGPAMTVDEVPGIDPKFKHRPEGTKRDDYHCEWFKGATAARGDYSEHLLQPYVAPVKK